MTLVPHGFDADPIAFPDATADPTSPALPPPPPYLPPVNKIQHRRATAAAWVAQNPVLASGEPAYEEDTGRQKIGNGYTRWLDLPYFGDPADEAASRQDLLDHVNSDAPHPVYDDGPSLFLLYENAKVG